MAEDKTEKKDKTKDAVKLNKTAVEIISKVENMSVLELNQLVKALEEKFGVTAAAPVAVASSATPTEEAKEKVEEKAIVAVVLTSMGTNKIAVIKAVREINQNLGLKDAKELVEAAPKTVVEGIKREEAEEFKKKLKEAGASVELK